ncbi:MAG: SMC family ATPase, partial [Deltaproteobacteria bacterium]|nr:SMC family ATPase [Deltaproteobacteria bacterium]
MRPLELIVEGFRSYGDRERFDWRERRLVGVVGPIGSGKSSILDAISFALFGKTPVFEKDRKSLINQRSELMRVELAFEVDGDVWRVIRVIRRKGAALHSLLKHPEGDLQAQPVEVASKDREVTSAVEGLLGLDFPAFCRSVLLAQNRFSELLSSPPGERDQVLKTLFGFERVDKMRQLARERVVEAEAEARGFEAQAQELERDREQRSAVKEQLVEAQQREQAFAEVAPQIKEQALEREAQQRHKEQADAELTKLAEIAGDVPGASRVSEMARARAQVDEALTGAEGALRLAGQALHAAEAEQQAVEEAVGSLAALQRAEGLIDKLEEERARRESLEAKQVNLEAARGRARGDLQTKVLQLNEARAALEQAQKPRARAGEEHAAAQGELNERIAQVGDRDTLEGLRDELRQLEHEERNLKVVAEAVTSGEQALEEGVERLARAQGALTQREEAKAQAAEALASVKGDVSAVDEVVQRAQRDEMALTLRGGLQLGERCPVCEQQVPVLPEQQTSPDVDAAQGRREELRHVLKHAEQAFAQAGEQVAAREQEVKTQKARLVELRETLAGRHEALGGAQAAVSGRETALREVLGKGDLATLLRATEAGVRQAEAKISELAEEHRRGQAAEKDAEHALKLAELAEVSLVKELSSLEGRGDEITSDVQASKESGEHLEHEITTALGAPPFRPRLTKARERSRVARVALEVAGKG